MNDLTPVQNRNGRWYKREDLHRHQSGVNGAKWRQCQHLMSRYAAQGYSTVVTGASVLSPQHAMTAVAARMNGMNSVHVIGGTTPEKAVRHPSVASAVYYGAELHAIPVGYNPALQSEVRKLADRFGAAILHYGVTTRPDADLDEIRAFHAVGAAQTQNLPTDIRHLIAPLGSGNSAVSLLVGLDSHPTPPALYLVGIGPDRIKWTLDRTHRILGHPPTTRIHHVDLHGSKQVTYGDKRPYNADGITLHPTYEGKVTTWLDANPSFCPAWGNRDNDTALWIVGGPL